MVFKTQWKSLQIIFCQSVHEEEEKVSVIETWIFQIQKLSNNIADNLKAK